MVGVVSVLLGLTLMVLVLWPQTILPQSVPSIALSLLIALVTYVLFSKHSLADDKRTWQLLLMLFLLQLIITISLNKFWWWPQSDASAAGAFVGNDWDRYEMIGRDVASGNYGLYGLAGLPFEDIGTSLYVAIIYSVFGRNPSVLAITNTLLLALSSLGIYRLAARSGDVQVARRASVLWALLPIGLLHSVFPSKDILIVVLFIAMHCWVEDLLDNGKKKQPGILLRVLFLAIGLLMCVLLRPAMAGIFLMVVLVRLSFWKKTTLDRGLRWKILLIVFLTVTVGSALYWRQGALGREIQFTPITTQQLDRSSSEFTFSAGRGGSLAFRTYWEGDWRYAYLVPLRVPLTIFSPFPPIDFSGIYQGALSVNLWVLVLIGPGCIGAFFAGNGFAGRRLVALAPYWLPIVVIGVVLAASVPIIQTRYAMPVYPYMIILAMIGFSKWTVTKKLYVFLPPLLIGMFALYVFLKA